MRILVADDDPLCRKMLEDTLASWGYEVVAVADGTEAWHVLQLDSSPQMAILDWVMPGIDGLEICRLLRRASKELYTYVVLVTAREGKELAIAGLEAGADDYLVKPVNVSELQARLRTGIRILDLQHHLIAGREDLKVQATHDPLTGLCSRAEILLLLRRELARAERVGTKVGVLMVDLDHFKDINDSYGHLSGDAVLREVSRRMRSSLRPYDGIGRYGGDEFLLVLPGCDGASVVRVAERIRRSLAGRAIETGIEPVFITLSMGVSVGTEVLEGGVESVLRAAEGALRRSKKEGRNRVTLSKAEEEDAANLSESPSAASLRS